MLGEKNLSTEIEINFTAQFDHDITSDLIYCYLNSEDDFGYMIQDSSILESLGHTHVWRYRGRIRNSNEELLCKIIDFVMRNAMNFSIESDGEDDWTRDQTYYILDTYSSEALRFRDFASKWLSYKEPHNLSFENRKYVDAIVKSKPSPKEREFLLMEYCIFNDTSLESVLKYLNPVVIEKPVKEKSQPYVEKPLPPVRDILYGSDLSRIKEFVDIFSGDNLELFQDQCMFFAKNNQVSYELVLKVALSFAERRGLKFEQS